MRRTVDAIRQSWQTAVRSIVQQPAGTADQVKASVVDRPETPPAIYPSLIGKVVLVTGGASGIGEEIVRSFAIQGARVGFIDRDTDRGAFVHRDLQGQGFSATFLPCDLKDIDALKDGARRFSEMFGPITVLVNNAADDDRHDWTEVTPAHFDERIAANLRHFFFAIQAVAPGMIDAGTGSIVNLGSIAAWQGYNGLSVYSAAKAGIHGITRSFARELGPHRVRVNTVVPGWVMTDRQKQLWASPEAVRQHLQRQCLPDPIQPADVARLVLFLAADDSAMCTAGSYEVQGGYM